MSSPVASLSSLMADVVARASAAVVSVHARARLPSSGVHWRDGIVVTTDGTVRRDHDLFVTVPDGRRVPAQLAGRDPGTDLAVLRIDPGTTPVARPGDPTTLRPGHLILALGRTGDSGPRTGFGVVSATGGKWRCWKGGELDLLIQSDLPVHPGMGGGPMVSLEGETLGVNSGALSRPLVTTIPVSTVERVLDQILTRGYVARGWLGAAMQPVRFSDSDRQRTGVTSEGGLVILAVEPEGPAAKAGLLIGDIIVALNGQESVHPDQVLGLLAGDAVGRTLRVDLVRGGRSMQLDIVVDERPRRAK